MGKTQQCWCKALVALKSDRKQNFKFNLILTLHFLCQLPKKQYELTGTKSAYEMLVKLIPCCYENRCFFLHNIFQSSKYFSIPKVQLQKLCHILYCVYQEFGFNLDDGWFISGHFQREFGQLGAGENWGKQKINRPNIGCFMDFVYSFFVSKSLIHKLVFDV
jgi:hypothetical protein